MSLRSQYYWFLACIMCRGLAGCGSERLSVNVTVPSAYEDAVTRFGLDVLEPQTDDWSCDALAFGLRGDAEIQSILVATVSFAPGAPSEAPLSVRRDGRQLLVAHGFTADGRRIVSGCAERGPHVLGDVDVVTMPRTRLAADTPLELFDGKLYGQMPPRLSVAVSDVFDGALTAMAVRWSIEGSANYLLEVETASGDDGVAELAPVLGPLGGPYRVRARGRWSEDPLPEIVTFELGEAAETPLARPPIQLSTIGANRGGPALLATLGDGECATDAFVAVSVGRNDTLSFPGCARAGTVGVGDRDVPLLAVNIPGQVSRLARLSLEPRAAEDCGPLPLPPGEAECVVTDIYDADPCQHSGRALLKLACPAGAATTVTKARVFDVRSCAVSDLGVPDLAVTASTQPISQLGCVDIDGAPTNVAVGRSSGRDVLFVAGAPDAPRRVKGLVQLYRFRQSGDAHLLLGLGSNGDDLRVLTVTLRNEGPEEALLTNIATAFDVPNRPVTAAIADFDGDGVEDLFSLTRTSDPLTRSVLLCLGRVTTSPICALGFELGNDGRDLVDTADLDGDGISDFLTATNARGAWRILSNSLARGL